MKLTILAFAQAREAYGFSARVVACEAGETVREVLGRVVPGADWGTLAVALDREYVLLDTLVGGAAELALIPPVSGG